MKVLLRDVMYLTEETVTVTKNLYLIRKQHKFSIHIWCRIIGDLIVDHYELPASGVFLSLAKQFTNFDR